MFDVSGCHVWVKDHIGVLGKEWSFALKVRRLMSVNGLAVRKMSRSSTSCSALCIDFCSLSKAF